jgi:hypothetical protein
MPRLLTLISILQSPPEKEQTSAFSPSYKNTPKYKVEVVVLLGLLGKLIHSKENHKFQNFTGREELPNNFYAMATS